MCDTVYTLTKKFNLIGKLFHNLLLLVVAYFF